MGVQGVATKIVTTKTPLKTLEQAMVLLTSQLVSSGYRVRRIGNNKIFVMKALSGMRDEIPRTTVSMLIRAEEYTQGSPDAYRLLVERQRVEFVVLKDCAGRPLHFESLDGLFFVMI